MAQNLNEYIGLASGLNETLSNATACALDSVTLIQQCNLHTTEAFYWGMFIGGLMVGIGVILGVWYRGRQN